MGPHDLLAVAVGIRERLKTPYLVTGPVASMAYGEPRVVNIPCMFLTQRRISKRSKPILKVTKRT